MSDDKIIVPESVEKQLTGKGFASHPENINPLGRPEAGTTYAELIREVGEQESRKKEGVTRRKFSVDVQWQKAENGELASLNWLADRDEGKPLQRSDITTQGEKIQGIAVEFVHVKTHDTNPGSV